eukprot:3176843-Pleurochrysis_carterae.AAC.1
MVVDVTKALRMCCSIGSGDDGDATDALNAELAKALSVRHCARLAPPLEMDDDDGVSVSGPRSLSTRILISKAPLLGMDGAESRDGRAADRGGGEGAAAAAGVRGGACGCGCIADTADAGVVGDRECGRNAGEVISVGASGSRAPTPGCQDEKNASASNEDRQGSNAARGAGTDAGDPLAACASGVHSYAPSRTRKSGLVCASAS